MVENYSGINVLVVDDQENFLDAVAFEFEILGCNPIKAKNGLDAMEKFKNNKVDVIISDIRMPVCDGSEFLDRLRKISKTKPPFIFMTGFADLKPYDAYDRGADAFIGKPLKPNEIAQLLKTFLCQDSKKWSEESTDAVVVEVKGALGELTSNPHFQVGRSGFFISYSIAPSLQGLAKNALIQFDFSTETELIKSFKGRGRIVWIRDDSDDGLIAGCGIAIDSLDKEFRGEIIKFLSIHNGIKTIPKGALQPSKSTEG